MCTGPFIRQEEGWHSEWTRRIRGSCWSFRVTVNTRRKLERDRSCGHDHGEADSRMCSNQEACGTLISHKLYLFQSEGNNAPFGNLVVQ